MSHKQRTLPCDSWANTASQQLATSPYVLPCPLGGRLHRNDAMDTHSERARKIQKEGTTAVVMVYGIQQQYCCSLDETANNERLYRELCVRLCVMCGGAPLCCRGYTSGTAPLEQSSSSGSGSSGVATQQHSNYSSIASPAVATLLLYLCS